MEMKYYRATSANESGVFREEGEILSSFVYRADIEIDRPVRHALDKKNLTQDFVDAGSGFLVSPRLYDVLSKLTDNYKAYPAVIKKKDGRLIEDYRIFHISDVIACFNWNKSIYLGRNDDTGKPKFATTIVLDRNAILEHQDKNIFRMKEISGAIIINEYAKNMLKDANITGFSYKKLAVE